MREHILPFITRRPILPHAFALSNTECSSRACCQSLSESEGLPVPTEKRRPKIQYTLSRNIKAAREKLGYSQQALAERADLSAGHMNDLEQGRKWVSADTLERLADALLMEPWMLLIPEDAHGRLADYDLLTHFASRMRDQLNT
ncbi:MAG: helix-turn-helix domain-containing protein, partial [Spirochaetales bacterium]|nr:helix-turn-helix domain-containing protein [Spirochaetales bacterium]